MQNLFQSHSSRIKYVLPIYEYSLNDSRKVVGMYGKCCKREQANPQREIIADRWAVAREGYLAKRC